MNSTLREYVLYVAVVTFTFGVLLFSPFVYDDVFVVESNLLLRSWSGLGEVWRGHVDHLRDMDGAYRPLFLSWLSLVGSVSQFSPGVFRFCSFLLHAANGLGVFLIARRMFRIDINTARLLAVVFLIHPIHVTDLDLVWKQSDLWIGFVAIYSILSMEAWNRTGQVKWIVGGLGLLGLGFGMKESAIIIPLLWLTAEPIWNNPQRRRLRLSFIGIGLVLSVTYYFILQAVTVLPRIPEGNPSGRGEYFLTQLSIFPVYLRALFDPSILTIDRGFPIVSKWNTSVVATFAIGCSLIFAAVWGLVRKKSFAAVPVIWAVIWLIPTSSFQPLALPYDETRLYLVVASLAWLAGIAYTNYVQGATLGPWIKRGSVGSLVGILMLASWMQTDRFRTPEKLWMAVVDVDPRSARGHYNLGVVADRNRQWDLAEQQYRKALHYGPNLESARLNLGIVRGRKGALDEAAYHFSKLLSGRAHYAAKGHYHLVLDAFYRDQIGRAPFHIEQIRKLDPQSGLAEKAQALYLERIGRTQEAIEFWKRYTAYDRVSDEQKVIALREIARLATRPPVR